MTKEIIDEIREFHNLPIDITDEQIAHLYKHTYFVASLKLAKEIAKLKEAMIEPLKQFFKKG